MTKYELARLLAEPFFPALEGKVRRDLRCLLNETRCRSAQILDVGGRKSPYTIGVPAMVTILDLPRREELQKLLNLGLTDHILRDLQQRRSNIKQVVLQDMTQCTLDSSCFDGVVCVEVIEHVPDDTAFVTQIARVLKPGGWLYLTTPNGDYVRNEPPNYNPNHIRHYTRASLTKLLNNHFVDVNVKYGIKTGKYRYLGLQSMNLAKPVHLFRSMVCNLISQIESRGLDEQPRRTAHLFAVAWKP
jgi:SAM-dependent methyltransferase